MRLTCNKNKGAALLTKHRSVREFAVCEPKLRAYMLSNWQWWFQFAQEKGRPVQLQDLILVRECTLTGDWANVTCDTTTTDMEVSFKVQVP